MGASPWTFHSHPGAWASVAALGLGFGLALRRPRRRMTRRQALAFAGGLVGLAVALTWPLADLATHFSLLALVTQHLLLVLAVPALLVLGMPVALVAALTRPAPIDAAVRAVSRPPIAVGIVTITAVATVSTGAVDAQASSGVVRAVLEASLILAGFVLWAPVLTCLPGTHRPSLPARAAYLIVQSIVPAFLSLVWIFARHPLYPTLAHHERLFGLSPLVDQQLAGFVAKLATIATLWSVAYVIMMRRRPGGPGEAESDEDPLTWADVERELERVERRQRRISNVEPPPAVGHGP